MTLAVQMLAVAGIGLVLLLTLILLYWLWTYTLKACCCRTLRDDHPTEVVVAPRCSCSDLRITGFVKVAPGDGDGFTFSPQCFFHPDVKDISVRLAGIDAPEMPKPAKGEPGQPFAPEATNLLTDLILGKTLEIDKYGNDQYGRVLAVALVPQEGSPPLNVNIELVRRGLAEVYVGQGCVYGDYGPQLKELMEDAKSARIGFWSRMDDPNFETPRQYKRRMRARQKPLPPHQRYQQRQPPSFQRRSSQKHCLIS